MWYLPLPVEKVMVSGAHLSSMSASGAAENEGRRDGGDAAA
jgi:hypothetical protein